MRNPFATFYSSRVLVTQQAKLIGQVPTYIFYGKEREKKRKNDNTYSEMKITCQPAFLLYIYYTGIHGKHFLWDSNFFFHIETFNFSFFISFFSLVLSLPFFLINFFSSAHVQNFLMLLFNKINIRIYTVQNRGRWSQCRFSLFFLKNSLY